MPRAKQKKASCSLTEVVFVLVLLACGFMIGFVGSHTSEEEDAPVRLRQHPAMPPKHLADQHSSGPLNASMWGHIPKPFDGYAPLCGPTPEEGYPKTAPIKDIIKNWNPDAGKWTPERMYLCGNQIYGAFVLNRRVNLHAIDATAARWRGDVGSSPLDGASAATCTRHTG